MLGRRNGTSPIFNTKNHRTFYSFSSAIELFATTNGTLLKEEIQEFLKSIPNDIKVVNEGINNAIVSDFYKYGVSASKEGDISPIDINDIEQTKRTLAALAITGGIKNYRQIEDFIKKCGDKYLKSFATVGLLFCRHKIEEFLLDEDAVLIYGGLGAVDNRMRFFAAIPTKHPLSQKEQKEVVLRFHTSVNKADSILEEVQYHDRYIVVIILGSMHYAIGPILDNALAGVVFLEPEYYLTNAEIPSAEAIINWIENGVTEDDDSELPF